MTRQCPPRLPILFLALSAVVATGASAEGIRPREDRTVECGELFNSTGPYDFRDRSKANVWNVNDTWKNHYDPAVARMKTGEYSARVMHDIDFLLRVFPNHYPALTLAMEYEFRGGKLTHRSTDCYFDRARRFVPNDVKVVIMEASYFRKRGDKARALSSFEDALEMAPTSIDVNYNAGLFLTETGDYERALACARIAYDGGYPLPGLRDKLARAGYKVELESKPTPAGEADVAAERPE
jgi:tetratricopeptide (TPR) repeat protein